MFYFYIIDKFMTLKGKDFIEAQLELIDSLNYLNLFYDFFEAKAITFLILMLLSYEPLSLAFDLYCLTRDQYSFGVSFQIFSVFSCSFSQLEVFTVFFFTASSTWSIIELTSCLLSVEMSDCGGNAVKGWTKTQHQHIKLISLAYVFRFFFHS